MFVLVDKRCCLCWLLLIFNVANLNSMAGVFVFVFVFVVDAKVHTNQTFCNDYPAFNLG